MVGCSQESMQLAERRHLPNSAPETQIYFVFFFKICIGTFDSEKVPNIIRVQRITVCGKSSQARARFARDSEYIKNKIEP